MSQRARGAINENKVVMCVHGSRQKTREVGAVRLRWADTASIPARRRKKPTNDKKQALPATQKPRVMRIIITVDYARRGPQVGGSGDAQTHCKGGWGAGCARATTEASFRSITCCSNACARAGS